MPENDKEDSILHLRETLLKDIELQTQLRIQYQRILRRFSFIYIGLAMILLIGIGIIIFLINQPSPATAITLKNVEELQKNIEIEHKLVLMDRLDVARAREQVLELQRNMLKRDSLNNEK